MNPPTVEGWHTGSVWIDGGTLTERVNFAVNQFNETSTPGFQDILRRLGDTVKAEDLLEKCLELLGPLQLGEDCSSRREPQGNPERYCRGTTGPNSVDTENTNSTS